MIRKISVSTVLLVLFASVVFASGRVIIGTRNAPPDKLRECQALLAAVSNLGDGPTNDAIIVEMAKLDLEEDDPNFVSMIHFTRPSISDECSNFASLSVLADQLCSARGSTVYQARAKNHGMIWCADGTFMRVDSCE